MIYRNSFSNYTASLFLPRQLVRIARSRIPYLPAATTVVLTIGSKPSAFFAAHDADVIIVNDAIDPTDVLRSIVHDNHATITTLSQV